MSFFFIFRFNTNQKWNCHHYSLAWHQQHLNSGEGKEILNAPPRPTSSKLPLFLRALRGLVAALHKGPWCQWCKYWEVYLQPESFAMGLNLDLLQCHCDPKYHGPSLMVLLTLWLNTFNQPTTHQVNLCKQLNTWSHHRVLACTSPDQILLPAGPTKNKSKQEKIDAFKPGPRSACSCLFLHKPATTPCRNPSIITPFYLVLLQCDTLWGSKMKSFPKRYQNFNGLNVSQMVGKLRSTAF